MNSLDVKIRDKVVGGKGSPWPIVSQEVDLITKICRALVNRLDARGMQALCNPLDLHVRDRRYAVSYGPVVYGEVRAIRGKAAGDRVAITIRQSVQRGRSSDETS